MSRVTFMESDPSRSGTLITRVYADRILGTRITRIYADRKRGTRITRITRIGSWDADHADLRGSDLGDADYADHADGSWVNADLLRSDLRNPCHPRSNVIRGIRVET